MPSINLNKTKQKTKNLLTDAIGLVTFLTDFNLHSACVTRDGVWTEITLLN